MYEPSDYPRLPLMRSSLSAQPALGHLVTHLVAAHLENLSGKRHCAKVGTSGLGHDDDDGCIRCFKFDRRDGHVRPNWALEDL